MPFLEVVSRCLDRIVRPEFPIRNRSWAAFQVCGYVGLTLAVALSMVLVAHRGLSPWVMAAVAVGAVGSFFGLAMLTKIVTGREDLVYYRHEIAVLIVAASMLGLMRQPILAYLDATILGVGLFLACGRIGCLMVGCCHGLPHSWGVRYREEHTAAGFPSYFVGVRLFPIQLVESLSVLGIVCVGSILVWTGDRPGSGLAAYVSAYAVGRFWFEFWRGDLDRPYFGGFSEAQWSSFVLLGAVAVAEQMGVLPWEGWHVAALTSLVLAAVVVAGRRFGRKAEYALLRPHHVMEVSQALDWAASRPARLAGVEVWRTSLGIRLSASTIETDRERLQQYTLSGENGLTEDAARLLARLIARLKHPFGSTEIIRGNRGVFHVLIRPTI